MTGIQGLDRLRHRSPGGAGVLSAIVPGLGQAYSGRWGEAFSALFVNAGLIATEVQLARSGLWFAFATVGLFEVSFYGGNIMSAVSGARRFNRREPEQRARPLIAGHEPVFHATEAGLAAEIPATR